MLDLAGPITVAFDQPVNKEQCYVTEPSKTIVMSPNCAQQPLEKIIATITGKKSGSSFQSDQIIDLSLVRKCCRMVNQKSQKKTNQHSHQTTIDLRGDDVIQDNCVTKATSSHETDHSVADDGKVQESGENHLKKETVIAKHPLVSVLSRGTKPTVKRDRPKNVTTLTSSEFAQLLKTCNVTVKSVRSSDTCDKKGAKKTPRDGAVVLRPSWTRAKTMAPPLKWHHTNFDPSKQLKVGKSRKTCKAVSVTVAKPSHKHRKKSPSTDGHTRSLSSHALPLTQAWTDLASRDQASAETIKETSDDALDALLPQNADPFLSDCDVREAANVSSNVVTSHGLLGDVIDLSSPASREIEKTTGNEHDDVTTDVRWNCSVRMSDNSPTDSAVDSDMLHSDVTDYNSLFSEMTQYVDSQQPQQQFFFNPMAPTNDFGTIFEDLLSCENPKLLNDADISDVLNSSFLGMGNDVEDYDVMNISHPATNYGYCYSNNPPPPLLRHDQLTSPRTCDHQMSHSFSDTDSGIHSPGSTPVKSSPPPFDDVVEAKRDWRAFGGCHSEPASTCVRSPTLEQFCFNATASPSNFYATPTGPQEVHSPQTSSAPSPDPDKELHNMDAPTYYTADAFDSYLTPDPSILAPKQSYIKAENIYFNTPEMSEQASPESPFEIPAAENKTKPKYRHRVGNWQIAVSLQPEKDLKLETSGDNQRSFEADLSAKTLDQNPLRRRKPKPVPPKRKVASLTEGQLCVKVRKLSTEKGKTVHLWEFIRDILLNPDHCPTLIKWEDRQLGVFRFVQSDVVASMWGEKKRNPKMTYEKLSRAMRYYYNRGILERVDGRRLVYKFGPNAHGWRVPDVVTSAEEGESQTIVEHLCESTGLTIQSEVGRKQPSAATSRTESKSADPERFQSPPIETKVSGSSRPKITTVKSLPVFSSGQSRKAPVTSWIVTSSPTSECASALPSANVLLAKQIRLAVTN